MFNKSKIEKLELELALAESAKREAMAEYKAFREACYRAAGGRLSPYWADVSDDDIVIEKVVELLAASKNPSKKWKDRIEGLEEELRLKNEALKLKRAYIEGLQAR